MRKSKQSNNNNLINTNLNCYWEFRNVKYKYLGRMNIIQFNSIQFLFNNNNNNNMGRLILLNSETSQWPIPLKKKKMMMMIKKRIIFVFI
jgi:hypothetical protein